MKQTYTSFKLNKSYKQCNDTWLILKRVSNATLITIENEPANSSDNILMARRFQKTTSLGGKKNFSFVESIKDTGLVGLIQLNILLHVRFITIFKIKSIVLIFLTDVSGSLKNYC